MTLRTVSFIFALIFLGLGFAWHVPSLHHHGLLFGLYEINNIHNLIHIGTGLLFLLGAARAQTAKLFLQLFGFVYIVLGVAGYATQGQLGLLQLNLADDILHFALGLIALYFGLKFRATRG